MSDDMFGGPKVEDVSIVRQIDCVKRELRIREQVYPRWVECSRMSQREADDEILCMKAVIATLTGMLGKP